MNELKHAQNAFFVTLTYSDENLNYGVDDTPTLNKYEIQCFLKRLRHLFKSEVPNIQKSSNGLKTHENAFKTKFKYFIVGEYGSQTSRPHYHCLLFNIPYSGDISEIILKAWQKKGEQLGNIHLGNVTVQSISYTAKYIINTIEDFTNKEKCFAMMSLRPAIGYGYIESHGDYHKKGQIFYGMMEGNKVNLPRYYKGKIFDKTSLELNLMRVRNLTEAKYAEKLEKYIASGDDFFNSELEGTEQKINSIKLRNKKSNRL